MKEQEKRVYNSYLAITRSKQNKPFTLRKDFTDFVDTQEYSFVNRLTNFFNRYPHINIQEFFAAPYEIHTDTEHLPIKYYLGRPAIKAYSLYQKKLQDVSPDNQIESIRKSFQYIGSFCLRNKLRLEDYLFHKTGCIYSWMMHYKEHYINIYSLLEIGNISDVLNELAVDEKELLVDDLQQTLFKFKTRYHNSSVAKAFVKEGTEKLKHFLK